MSAMVRLACDAEVVNATASCTFFKVLACRKSPEVSLRVAESVQRAAEEVYTEDSAENAMALTGLAGVLAAQGRTADASTKLAAALQLKFKRRSAMMKLTLLLLLLLMLSHLKGLPMCMSALVCT
jgi:hypothetical protein